MCAVCAACISGRSFVKKDIFYFQLWGYFRSVRQKGSFCSLLPPRAAKSASVCVWSVHQMAPNVHQKYKYKPASLHFLLFSSLTLSHTLSHTLTLSLSHSLYPEVYLLNKASSAIISKPTSCPSPTHTPHSPSPPPRPLYIL